MAILKNNGLKYLLAYLFFLSVTTTRFFFEAHFANFVDKENLIFHHHYWFLFVFLLFLINFRYFLGLHPSRSWWMAFCSPVILLPLIYNLIFRGGSLVKFNYLSALDLPNYFKDIATFMIFSQKNRPIAIELIIITLSIFLFSLFITKKTVRSILCALSCYLSLMIFAGTGLIAPHKPEFTLLVLSTSLKLQNFMSFLYFFAAMIAALILFFEEISDFLREKKRFMSFITLSSSFFISMQFMLTSPSITDRIFMIPHSLLFSILITVMIFLKKQYALKALLIVQTAFSMGIILRAFS